MRSKQCKSRKNMKLIEKTYILRGFINLLLKILWKILKECQSQSLFLCRQKSIVINFLEQFGISNENSIVIFEVLSKLMLKTILINVFNSFILELKVHILAKAILQNPCDQLLGKEPSIKYIRKVFQKTNISNPLIRTRTYS